MNTFNADDNNGPAKPANRTESSKTYQPYVIGQTSKYSDEERSTSDDDSDISGKKKELSDDELSSEPGYLRVGENGKIIRDGVDRPREPAKPNPNDIYSKLQKRNNNNRSLPNGRKYSIAVEKLAEYCRGLVYKRPSLIYFTLQYASLCKCVPLFQSKYSYLFFSRCSTTSVSSTFDCRQSPSSLPCWPFRSWRSFCCVLRRSTTPSHASLTKFAHYTRYSSLFWPSIVMCVSAYTDTKLQP